MHLNPLFKETPKIPIMAVKAFTSQNTVKLDRENYPQIESIVKTVYDSYFKENMQAWRQEASDAYNMLFNSTYPYSKLTSDLYEPSDNVTYSDLKSMVKELESDLLGLDREMDGQISNLDSRIDSLLSRVQANEGNISSLTSRVTALESDRALKTELSALETSLDARLDTLENDTTVSTLQSNLQTLSGKVTANEGSITSISSRVTTLENDTTVSTLQSDLETLSQAITSLQTALAELIERVTALETPAQGN